MNVQTATKQPDDSEPSPDRQHELERAFDENMRTGKAPYAGVHIRTRGELRWIKAQRDWVDERDAEGRERANLGGADPAGADFAGADLHWANLSGADLWWANLSRANLKGANLSGANLRWAIMNGADVLGADLSGTILLGTRMDAATDLTDATLSSRTLLADLVWNFVPVTRLNWDDVKTLGDEYVAVHQPKDDDGKTKDRVTRLRDFTNAVRANNQVATLLRSQGLNEHADRFAFRAQVLQRQVLWRQVFVREKGRPHSVWWRLRKLAAYYWSWFLAIIAGYGYRPTRSVIAYLVVILGFASLYYVIGQQVGPPLPPLAALVFSVTSFHGRGFFPGTIPSLTDPLVIYAAAEAVIGLVIEITFIATFTNRFFAR